MMHHNLKSPSVLLSEEGVAKVADVGIIDAQPVKTRLWAAPELSI